MKMEYQKVYVDIPEFSNQEYHDLNHFVDNNPNNSLNDFSDEMTIFEILKLIENPEEHINSELPFILENLINSKKLDETNTNAILIGDLSRIIIQHLKWNKCFPNIKPFYKVEANNNQELLKVIKKLGINFICTKASEIEDIINVDNSENQSVYCSVNNYESAVKLNNSFIINNSVIKNPSSKVNFNALNPNGDNSLNEANSVKIMFSSKSSENNAFSNENLNSENNNFSKVLKSYEKKIDSYICDNIEEIQNIIETISSAKIILRVFVNDYSEITRAERNRLNEIFETLEELELTTYIKGISLELITVSNNEIGNYIKTNKIYEVIKRAREIIDQAEEFGIEIKIFDIGSLDNEAILNEENIKILNESLDYFFSDLKIEFISQLGKFFCAPAFCLLQRNSRKADNLNTNENLNNISSDNNLIISNSNSSSSSNLAALNSTELSVNGNISSINQNSTYYLDLDFLPLEENNNLGLNNPEESPNNIINKNFSEDFILNNSSILDSPISNSKENVINLQNDIVIDENLNKFICISNTQNYAAEIDFNRIKLEETAFEYENKTVSDNIKNEKQIKKTKLKSSKKKKLSVQAIRKGINFDDQLKEEIRKIDCETRNCYKWKMENFDCDSDRKFLEDWFLFENVGGDEICSDCKTNGYCKPEIYYISNRISIKLEKYFYVIMNKFDS